MRFRACTTGCGQPGYRYVRAPHRQEPAQTSAQGYRCSWMPLASQGLSSRSQNGTSSLDQDLTSEGRIESATCIRPCMHARTHVRACACSYRLPALVPFSPMRLESSSWAWAAGPRRPCMHGSAGRDIDRYRSRLIDSRGCWAADVAARRVTSALGALLLGRDVCAMKRVADLVILAPALSKPVHYECLVDVLGQVLDLLRNHAYAAECRYMEYWYVGSRVTAYMYAHACIHHVPGTASRGRRWTWHHQSRPSQQ